MSTSPLRNAAPLALALLTACSSCSTQEPQPEPQNGGASAAQDNPSPGVQEVKIHKYSIVKTYPHDRSSYTQGLVFHDGVLYEGTGRYGESTLMTVDLETGKSKLRHRLEDAYFGEGIAIWKGLLVQLTWQEGVAFVYDRRNFHEQYRLTYEGQGWGLCTDGEFLITSDGTDTLRFVGPTDLKVDHLLSVTWNKRPVYDLNELEFIKGEIWANLYQQELIVRIDPDSGEVRSVIDLNGLQDRQGVADQVQDVLNGIAYDEQQDKIYITGKHWPNLYEIRVDE